MTEFHVRIRNWEKFQHYKDRNPRWIKTYTELLSDDAYLGLTGHRRAILHGLWLEYASSACRLRLDTRLITRRLNLRVTMEDLYSLNEAGFIDIVASKPLAEPYQNAMPEKEKSREEQPSFLPTEPKEAGRSEGELEQINPRAYLERLRGAA